MFNFGIDYLRKFPLIIINLGIIVRPCDGCSSRRALIEIDNPCMHARVIVDSVDVVFRL